jgi:hypothetical protein
VGSCKDIEDTDFGESVDRVFAADLAILGHAEAGGGGKVAALHNTALHEDVRELLVDDLLTITSVSPLSNIFCNHCTK